MELQVHYMKIASAEHVLNMLCTQTVFCFCFDSQNNLCTQHVLSLWFSCHIDFGLVDARISASDKDLPLHLVGLM